MSSTTYYALCNNSNILVKLVKVVKVVDNVNNKFGNIVNNSAQVTGLQCNTVGGSLAL